MATKTDLGQWILDALQESGGSATIVEVARHIWSHHEDDLRQSGSIFYTWQYDMRWSAQKLRDSGALRTMKGQRDGLWHSSQRLLPPPSKGVDAGADQVETGSSHDQAPSH